VPNPGRHGQDQLVWACGLAPGRAPQILSSSRTRTTTAMPRLDHPRGFFSLSRPDRIRRPPYPTLARSRRLRVSDVAACVPDMSGCDAPIVMDAPTVLIGG
jgi:hypothetical protein